MQEFELLHRVFAANAGLPGSVTIAPGDDMGGIRWPGGQVLVTVDQLVDQVHFLLDRSTPDQIAHKLFLRNLSDVAAMAAKPVGCVVAALLSKSLPDAWAVGLTESLQERSAFFHCPLIGGDLASHDGPMVLTMTVLASESGVTAVTRSGAQVGDAVWVSGTLGGAWSSDGSGRHLSAEPRLLLSRRLCAYGFRPSAMIDLSDGLAGDLGHLCRSSGVIAEVSTDALPIDSACCGQNGQPRWHAAMTDGEDYELCWTLSPELSESLADKIAGVHLSRVGTILAADDRTPPGTVFARTADGRRVAVGGSWEHRTNG